MANYNVYRSPYMPSYGQRTPTDAVPGYGQLYQPTQPPPRPPRTNLFGGGAPVYTPPSYGGGGSGINDPTLAAGASYSGGGGSGPLPPGAIPYDPFNGGNTNILYSKGYRKKLVNGQWAWLPPPAPGTQAPATYFPT